MSEKVTYEKFVLGLGSIKKLVHKGAPDLDELTTRLMFKVFEHLSQAEWSFIVSASITTFKYWPSPAEMLELLTGSKEDIAETTAAALCDCIDKYKSQGTYYESRIVPKIGPAGHALVQKKGGWVNFVALTDETLMGVFKKQLVDELRATIAKEKRESLMPPEMKQQLPGKVHDEIQKLADQLSLVPARPLKADQHEN